MAAFILAARWSVNKQPCACTATRANTRALAVARLKPFRGAYNQTFRTFVALWFLNFETTAGLSAVENVSGVHTYTHMYGLQLG